jgi:hypothetical protein
MKAKNFINKFFNTTVVRKSLSFIRMKMLRIIIRREEEINCDE